MSITQSLIDIGDLITHIQNPAWPATVGVLQFPTVLLRPKERLNLEDFPAAVLSLDWKSQHEIQYHADARSHHKYYLAIYLFVGAKGTDLDELHQRIEPWPYLLFHAFASHITLSGDIEFLGSGDTEVFMPYIVGYFPWGGGTDAFFGLKTTLIVNEEGIENYQA